MKLTFIDLFMVRDALKAKIMLLKDNRESFYYFSDGQKKSHFDEKIKDFETLEAKINDEINRVSKEGETKNEEHFGI